MFVTPASLPGPVKAQVARKKEKGKRKKEKGRRSLEPATFALCLLPSALGFPHHSSPGLSRHFVTATAASDRTSQDSCSSVSAALRAASDRRSASIEFYGVGCLARLHGRTRKRAPAQRSGAPALGQIPENLGAPLPRLDALLVTGSGPVSRQSSPVLGHPSSKASGHPSAIILRLIAAPDDAARLTGNLTLT